MRYPSVAFVYVAGAADGPAVAVVDALGDAAFGIRIVEGWPLGEGDGLPCVAAGGAQPEVNMMTRSGIGTKMRTRDLM